MNQIWKTLTALKTAEKMGNQKKVISDLQKAASMPVKGNTNVCQNCGGLKSITIKISSKTKQKTTPALCACSNPI